MKTVYKINEYPCQNLMECDPYKTPYCKPPTRNGVCKEQEGKSQSDILPSLFGEWEIKLINNHPNYKEANAKVPGMKRLTPLRPDSRGIQLKAQVTICESPEKPKPEKPTSSSGQKRGSIQQTSSCKNDDSEDNMSNFCCARAPGKVWFKDPSTLKESCQPCADAADNATPAIGGYYCKLPATPPSPIKKKRKKSEKKAKKKALKKIASKKQGN